VSELIFEVRHAEEGGFVAKALGASIYCEADTVDAIKEQIRDAVRCHFDGPEAPAFLKLIFVTEETIAA
jgi:hypothetical protein